MPKKYSIFVSSTYEDLKTERKVVHDAIIKMGHTPIGMEYFPASNESQWKVIQRLIRECDYYVLIIGNRYGSIEEQSQMSYTELEFDYASSLNIPILSFIHNPKSKIKRKKVEPDESQLKLDAFRKRAQQKLCRFWNTPTELVTDVLISLMHEFEHDPQRGWIRAEIKQDNTNVTANDQQAAKQTSTKENILPAWQRLIDYKNLEDEELSGIYEETLQDLNNNAVDSPEALAIISYVFADLAENNIKPLTEGIAQVLKDNYHHVLSECSVRDVLYNKQISFFKTLNIYSGSAKRPETLLSLTECFQKEYDNLWEQMKDRMTLALEDISDETASQPIALLEVAVPDHSVTYYWADIFDKVDIDKFHQSILALSNKGRNLIATFFIERYMLKYTINENNDTFCRILEKDNLEKLAKYLSVDVSTTNGIVNQSYKFLLDAVSGALERVKGNKKLIL